MTDRELIDLAESSPPEELAEEQLEALRAALARAPELRESLVDRLRMEQFLADALGGVAVSVERIVNHPDPRSGAPNYWRWLGWGLATLVLLSLVAWQAWPENRPARQVARQQVTNPERENAVNEAAASSQQIGEPGKRETSSQDTAAPAASDKQPAQAVAMPGEAAASPPAKEPFRLVLEAESFQRGNAMIDRVRYGKGRGVLVFPNPGVAYVEYDVEAPEAGWYRLELCYAADEKSPVALSVNGQVVKRDAAGEDTGDWGVRGQQWKHEGEYQLVKGTNVLRLEAEISRKQRGRPGGFPQLDRLAFSLLTDHLPSGEPPLEPWSQLADASAPVPPFADVCFEDFYEQDRLRNSDLRRWFQAAGQEPLKFHDGSGGGAPGMEGLGRLRAPWSEDAALRLAMYDHHGVKLHFFHGDEGVTLWHYAYPPTWAAYRTTRKPGELRPASYALTATDNQVFHRSGAGTFEVRHAEGSLVVTRGDLRLFSVPLAGPPQEVYLEGRARFNGLAMLRSAGLPEAPRQRPLLLESGSTAELAWKAMLPEGARLNKLEDGSLELACDKGKSRASATLALPEQGLHEAIFEIENPQPGAGVFLADARGEPLHQVSFLRDGRSGWTSYAFLWPGDLRTDSNYDLNQAPAPYALPRQWLKLVLGCGTVKCFTSGDGLHWSRALAPLSFDRGMKPCVQVGLYCMQGDGPRNVRLRRLEIRELDGLALLLPKEIKDRALALPGDDAFDAGSWLNAIVENQPADVDAAAWRQACAVRTLGAGPSPKLGVALIRGLLEDTIAGKRPWEEQRRILEDLAIISPTWDGNSGQALATTFVRAYERAGRNLAARNEPRPYSSMEQALLTSPLSTEQPISLMPETLVRQELLSLMHLDRWEDAASLAERLEFWNRSQDPSRRNFQQSDATSSLASLALGRAHRELGLQGEARRAEAPLGGGRRGEPFAQRAEWRHPLTEDLSKEGFNTLAEFNAALEGESYRDACQIISSADPAGVLGLLPDSKDRRLLVSLPSAVESAMREHPLLKQTMIEQFGPRGRLRVKQAIAEGDLSALQAASMQFSGTEAAAEARLWLGDRALSGGDFTAALAQYRQAAEVHLLSEAVLPRLRLAGAMLGRNVGRPATRDVQLGEREFTATEFEQLIGDQLRQRDADMGDLSTGGKASSLPPAWYESRKWADFNGDLGRDFQNAPFRDVDWAGRQLAAADAQDLLLLSNRFQVSAYDAKSGERNWNAEVGGNHGHAHAWAMIPMPPVVAGDRVFVRRLTNKGPELACLSLKNGKTQWTARPGDHVASDPLLTHDALIALTAEISQDPLISVSLCTFDPATGSVLAQKPLIQLRDAWNREVPCQATLADDKILAAVGGSVLCCDLAGQVEWIRRETWLPPSPPSVDARKLEVAAQPPLVAGDRAYVLQAGVRSVQCLHRASGRLAWRFTAPDVRRIVGLTQGRLVAETAEGLTAFDAADGKPLWRRAEQELLHAAICEADGELVVTAREQIADGLWRPCLRWLNVATGADVARSPLNELAGTDPRIGPLVKLGDRWLAPWINGGAEAKRKLREMFRRDASLPGGELASLAAWTTHLDARLLRASQAAAPGWSLISGEFDGETKLHADLADSKNVFVTLAGKQRPARFVKQLAVPAGGKARLVLDVGHRRGGKWGLDVGVGGDSVFSETIDQRRSDGGWRRIDLDLSRYAGRRPWLTVSHRDLGSPDSHALWRRMDVVVQQ